ncbi:MAG: hypothetical protein K2K80_08040 [Clostridia bacterium]|nr:hypothetical protein [Clostridia bacterium]MDE7439056.1 hypothetical protein [Clostridia bacterium]
MSNPKIPQGYQGTYARAADGSATLIMVSRSDSITDYTEKKEHKAMSNQPTNEQLAITGEQPHGQYTPYTTEQKKEYAKQFTREQIKSYRQGQKSAYAHMGNIGKRNSFFIHNNLKNDEATPPAPPPANKPKSTKKNQTGNK